MNDAIESQEYKGFTIEILPDVDPIDPRENDNLGVMVCWHRHYKLGDVMPKEPPNEWIASQLSLNTYADDYDESQNMEKFCKLNLVIPIMAYEHGGITIRAYSYGNWPDQNWDCGQLGFIYVSHEKIKQEYKVKRLSKSVLEKAKRVLEAEIDEYDDYLTGNVVGYSVKDSEGEVVDSCWGFFGDEGYKYAMQEAKSCADHLADEKQKLADALTQRLVIATAHNM